VIPLFILKLKLLEADVLLLVASVFYVSATKISWMIF